MTVLVALLSACALVPLLPTVPQGPVTATGIEGNWNFTRELIDSTVSNEGLPAGVSDVRYIVIRDVQCADDGACTATWSSSLTGFDSPDAATADLTFIDGVLTAVFESQYTDCATADGVLLQAGVWQIDNTYTLEASSQEGDQVTAFEGHGISAMSATPEADENCATSGDRTWAMSMRRAD